jgi:hypothetical protein
MTFRTGSSLLVAFSLLTIAGCSPSFCDCNDRWGDLSSSDQEKCAKMIDRMSTSEITLKMKECENK